MENQTVRPRRTLRDYLRIFGCGFTMGSADIVPGVSGGTMAFILGIYNELLESIRRFTGPECIGLTFRFRFRRLIQTMPWPFLLTLGIGILFAIVLFSTPIKWMLANKLVLILAFFFGLVAASVAAVLRRIEHWKISRFVALALGAAAGWIVVGLPLLKNPPAAPWYLVLCGAIAICAMILPGISGSFILLLLGKYDFILCAIHELKQGVNPGRNLLTLGLFFIGIVIGISSFVRLLGWLLRRWSDLTIAVLIGFMVGSLRKVWPWKIDNLIENGNTLPSAFGTEFFSALLLAAAGFALVMAVEHMARRLESRAEDRR